MRENEYKDESSEGIADEHPNVNESKHSDFPVDKEEEKGKDATKHGAEQPDELNHEPTYEEAMRALGCDDNFDDENFDMDDLEENIERLTRIEEMEEEHEKKAKKRKRGKNTSEKVLGKLTKQPSSIGWYKNWVVDWEEGDDAGDDDDDDFDDDDVEPEDEAEKSSWLARKAKKRFGDVWELVETYCQGWEDSPMDIATFFFCLAAFHTPPKDKKDAIFDEKLVLEGYHWAQFAFAAYKPEKKLVLERLPFLEEEDFICGNWDDLTLKNSPAYYVALDHDQKAIVVSLRGTKVKQDILTDLAAQFVKWENGHAHRGFVAALNTLEPHIKPVVETLKGKHPDYKVRVTGHSMGAAVSSLVVLKWAKEYPDWDIHGYGYATPCVISAKLLPESTKLFTTYVHNFDAVARLSMGSIEDLHHGMKLFAQKAGKNHNVLAIFQALRKIATKTDSDRIIRVAGEIDQLIQSNLEKELSEGKVTNHLFPAGITYQLWRENRGKNFVTWEMYKTQGELYGRLHFSPTMLKDHGSAGYTAAFENLLALSVIERKIWLNLKASQREAIKSYWNSFPDEDPFSEAYDASQAVENMKKESKYKKKAFDRGCIRPFLLLVSMSPKRRAAMCHLTGMEMIAKSWYTQFDSHHEAWYIIASHGKGIQSRGNSSSRTMIPFKHSSNWYMILHSCATKVKKTQGKFIDERISDMTRGTRKNYKQSIRHCKDSGDPTLPSFEEKVMLMFFDLVGTKDTLEVSKEAQNDPKKQELVEKLRLLGFHTKDFLNLIADQQINHSSNKKANEMYAWGDVVRHEDERVKKRQVAGMAGLVALSGLLFLSAAPMVVAMPPLALLPLGASIGIGSYVVTKATPGGLVAIVVGCLQQRLALAFHDIALEEYY
jgi:hypothetical protein